eukprot:148915-Amphidinium_carterae.1
MENLLRFQDKELQECIKRLGSASPGPLQTSVPLRGLRGGPGLPATLKKHFAARQDPPEVQHPEELPQAMHPVVEPQDLLR